MNTDIFTNEEFLSGDGMLTSVWGPSMWHFLHTMSFNYPVKPSKEDKDHYFNFILSIKHILPCKYCRDNFNKNIKKIGFKRGCMKNRTTFSKSIYNLHEEVNSMLGKESNLTYKDVKIRYEHFRSRCLVDEKKEKKLKHKSIENGCVDSLYGKKSKCVLQIVPKTSKIKSFRMSPKCKIHRVVNKK